LLAIERVRSGIATDLHDDIGSGLTRIAILADVASRQTASLEVEENRSGKVSEPVPGDDFSASSIVKKIGVHARELVDSMSDVVWSIDPKNFTVADLLARLRSFAYEMCEAKGIVLLFEVDNNISDLRLDPGIMRTLLLITKEGLNNSVKYSGCRTIHVRIDAAPREVRLLLSDDGTGFSYGTDSQGHGLVNMRSRAERLGGKFVLRSSPGSGTVIEVSIPGRT